MQVGGAGLAVMDDPQRGIQFGAEGLSIPLSQAGRKGPKTAKSRLGTFYARDSKLAEGGRSLFAGSESFKGTQLKSLKVLMASFCHSRPSLSLSVAYANATPVMPSCWVMHTVESCMSAV